MIVIKLGGSLDAGGGLLECLDKVERDFQASPIVLVPGGGLFADQVRLAQQRWRFGDDIAHQMALLAMQQMAFMYQGLKKDFVIAHKLAELPKIAARQIAIWSPDIEELAKTAIPANWEITSDSLAAWLAHYLGVDELVLVKSCSVDSGLSVVELARLNIVDSAFASFTAQARYKITVVQATSFYSDG